MKTNYFNSLLLSSIPVILILFCIDARAQVSIDTTMTIEELVNEVLLGDGITATNITYNGLPASTYNSTATGLFEASNTAFPIANGVVMTTGMAIGVSFENAWSTSGEPLAVQDDPDLVSISGQEMNDCAVLEFDFIATTDTFLIDYVFASYEYQNYTCSQYNDVFGIFLSGPGINGPFSNNSENIAVMPENEIPVSINTLNQGFASAFGEEENCLEANPNFVEDSIYYFDNNPQLENSIKQGGHTHMLTAFAQLVIGEQYHFKFAIGDAIDTALDSGVIMRSGSANSESELNEVTVQVNTVDLEIDPEGLFVAGTWNFFQPEPMVQVSGNVYATTTFLPANMNITYKFFNGSGANSSELVPENCGIQGVMPDGSRYLATSNQPKIVEPVCFGTCETCNEFLSAENKKPQDIKVFPNPSSGTFQLQSPSEGFTRIQALNSVGSMVLDKSLFLNSGENYTFEIEESGLYKVLISFERTGATYQSTVVVE